MIAKQEAGYIKGALFISYTGLKDYLKCPRSYYLKNVYRNPQTGYRLQIASPFMTLGALVHDAIKWYLQTNRVASKDDVIKKYRNHWLKYRGKKGGFESQEQEAMLGKRGLQMLDNFFAGSRLEPNLPIYDFLRYLVNDKVVMIGKLDFLGELPNGSLHVLDFKTGSKDEEDPLQLYIYAILAESNIQKPVSKISYWYLDRDLSFKEAVLDPLEERLEWIKDKCQQIQEAVKVNNWVCSKKEGLCRDCRNYQALIDGKGEYIFSDDEYKKEIYFLDQSTLEEVEIITPVEDIYTDPSFLLQK